MAKKKDYSNASAQELAAQVKALEEELRDLHFQVGANQLKNIRLIRQKRKEMARIKTVLAQN